MNVFVMNIFSFGLVVLKYLDILINVNSLVMIMKGKVCLFLVIKK